jgi:hypothetical protein
VFLFQIFSIALHPLPIPRDIEFIINDKLINNKFRFSIDGEGVEGYAENLK